MPHALRHNVTGELLACIQMNGYQLRYYGLVLWTEAPQEAERLETLIGSGIYGPLPDPQDRLADRLAADWEQVLELSRWQPWELTEHEAKIGNVKLRNDPRRRLYFRNGELLAEEKS